MKQLLYIAYILSISPVYSTEAPTRHALEQEAKNVVQALENQHPIPNTPQLSQLIRDIKNTAVGIPNRRVDIAINTGLHKNAFVIYKHILSRPKLSLNRGLFSSSLDEIRGVIAHEFGHIKYNHFYKQRLFLAGFGILLPALLVYKAILYIKKK